MKFFRFFIWFGCWGAMREKKVCPRKLLKVILSLWRRTDLKAEVIRTPEPMYEVLIEGQLIKSLLSPTVEFIAYWISLFTIAACLYVSIDEYQGRAAINKDTFLSHDAAIWVWINFEGLCAFFRVLVAMIKIRSPSKKNLGEMR